MTSIYAKRLRDYDGSLMRTLGCGYCLKGYPWTDDKVDAVAWMGGAHCLCVPCWHAYLKRQGIPDDPPLS